MERTAEEYLEMTKAYIDSSIQSRRVEITKLEAEISGLLDARSYVGNRLIDLNKSKGVPA